MQIEVKVDITTGKYGSTLGQTSITLDSDDVDHAGLSALVASVVQSAFKRAEAKLAEINEPETVVVGVRPPEALANV